MVYSNEFTGGFVFSRELTPVEVRLVNHFCGQLHQTLGSSVWCNWRVDTNSMHWNGSEKSHHMLEWARALIEHFFRPWGVGLHGRVVAQGEQKDDVWAMDAKGFEVKRLEGHMEFVQDYPLVPGPG